MQQQAYLDRDVAQGRHINSPKGYYKRLDDRSIVALLLTVTLSYKSSLHVIKKKNFKTLQEQDHWPNRSFNPALFLILIKAK